MTILKIKPIIELEHLFDYRNTKGDYEMLTENEEELLRMIRENDNPGQAVLIAIDTIFGYLTQRGSSVGRAAADLQELI